MAAAGDTPPTAAEPPAKKTQSMSKSFAMNGCISQNSKTGLVVGWPFIKLRRPKMLCMQ